jgi:peptide deformylase
MGWSVTQDHEALLRTGWKPIGDVVHGDEIGTLSPSGEFQWQHVMETHNYTYSGIMFEYASSDVNFKATPTHRLWLYNKDKRLPVSASIAKMRQNAKYNLYTAGKTFKELDGLSDQEIRVYASLLRSSATMNYATTRILRQDIVNWSDRQFAVFLDTMIADSSATVLAWRDKRHFLDALQIAAIQHGWTASIMMEARKQNVDTPGCFLTLKQCDLVEIDTQYIHVDKEFSGYVYCLSVPNRNFFLRRNGKVHVTGTR